MSLSEQIKNAYPELNKEFIDGTIVLQNDSDGYGDYIAVWEYQKPVPDGLALGRGKDVPNP